MLAPVLVLVVVNFHDDLEGERRARLDAQLLTASAVAAQADQAFDAAIGIGWAVAQDPLAQTMDPNVLDPHLRQLLSRHPYYDAINVFDAQGVNRGWGQLLTPAEPRLRIGDRPYFRKVIAGNSPQISDVIELRRPRVVGFVVCVPIRGADGKPIGVVNVVARADLLAQGYAGAGLQPGQSLFLTDRTGRLAFATSHPELSPEESLKLVDLPQLRQALAGKPHVGEYWSPLTGSHQLGAFVATRHHGWGAGAALSRDVAMQPVVRLLRNQLLAWGGLALLTAVIGTILARLLSRPLNRLEEHARAIGGGDLHRRVEIDSGDELEAVGRAFNEMAARLSARERELAQAHADLVRSERLAAVGQLAAVMAHEIRNPLGVIYNAVSALKRNTSAVDAAGLHGILQEEADRLNRIVSDLLDFGRPLRPAVEPQELELVVREALANALGGAANITVREEIAPDLPPLLMDARLIRQALINIAVNAVQAMPQGGTLHVRAERHQHNGEPAVRIDIRDEGAGISQETQARIFEPFFTTKATGTGLGLAVVKRIIDDHRGHISFHTAPGRGTTFSAWLPVSGAGAAVG